MDHTSEFVEKAWAGYVEKLIKVSAKKDYAITTKHQQIVDGACKVFFQKGFHPASIKDIAKAAEMSTGQLYHYISSKDDVLFLIHKHMQTSWYQFIYSSNIDEIGDPIKYLEYAIKLTFEFFIENKKLIQFVYTESKYLSKEHLRVVLEMDNKCVVQFWEKAVKHALGEQASDNYIKLAGNIAEYLLVFYPLRGWNLKDVSADEVSRFLVKFILQGLHLAQSADVEQ